MVAVRHPSGALTFHPPLGEERTRRSGRAVGRSVDFRVELAPGAPARRGIVGNVVKLVVVKLKEALVDEAVKLGMRMASRVAEKLWWQKRNLTEGLCGIEAAERGLSLRHLDRIDPGKRRALLFIHGTFSDTSGSFGKLLDPALLADLLRTYDGRVFGFEHFTVSCSPEENARSLLEALPDRETIFDVVSYSRGGLVLRMLAEQPERFGTLARRFKLGNGVLVAVPNGGTPLATGQRWEDTFGLVANLLEWLPDNPWTTGAEFVANGIVWMAGHATGDLPGIGAMDGESETIASLQDGGGPPVGDYSAIGANYHPENALWKRLLDAGIDGFFAGANDLVVPTDGAWQVDPGAPAVVPVERIACFGFDGNLRPHTANIHHLNVLGQTETSLFIQRALAGTAQKLQPLDLALPRRSHKPWRGGAEARPPAPAGASRPLALPLAPQPASVAKETAAKVTTMSVAPASGSSRQAPSREGDRTLHLMILGESGSTNSAQLLAMYGSARVVEPFPMRNREDASGDEAIAGTRFNKIITLHERIQMNLDGRIEKKTGEVPPLPNDESLCEFGELLFEALFVGRVRRLYDVARSEQRSEPLNIVFTCAIPWIAAKPWEFAFDPARRKFLATEEVHFIRNVLTSVPAQRVEECSRLRMLVVEAQPVGTVELAVEDETARIEHRFHLLTDAQLVEIEVLAEATPERLHEKLFGSWLERRPYDIVHFIGHGEFDREAEEGRLLFHSSDGGAQRVDVQTLREILCNRGVQVVFLNACDTARDANRVLNRGVAQALVQGGLPAVVANQYKVLDPSAIAFAEHFYWALAHGASLGEAARESRIAVNYSSERDLIDWAVPVIYARDPDYRLCKRLQHVASKTRARRPAPRAARPSARATEGRKIIGIADLARFFPGLPAIIGRLNAVQDQFEFRQVEVTAPMGVWDRHEGETYLHAKRFATKLQDKPRALGVDFLGCITNWWMRDNDTLNLYGWWSGKASLPILIFSTAGLALPADGPVAGRSLANESVAALAAQMIESQAKPGPIHDKPPTDCPFYYNQDRDVESVSGRLHFDAKCRKTLLATLPKATVAAFDALLAAYDTEVGDTP